MTTLDWYVIAVFACPVALAGSIACIVIGGARAAVRLESALDELRQETAERHRLAARVDALSGTVAAVNGKASAINAGLVSLVGNHNRLAASHGRLMQIVDGHIASHVESFEPSAN